MINPIISLFYKFVKKMPKKSKYTKKNYCRKLYPTSKNRSIIAEFNVIKDYMVINTNILFPTVLLAIMYEKVRI